LRNNALPYPQTGDNSMNKLILATLATAFTANVAIAQSVAETNGVLTASGRTLYTFDKDAANKSNCNGGCATAWPPFLVKDGDRTSAGFGVITRDDGAKQWAVNEKPLYFFAADAQAGDAKGDGQGGVWHIIRGASTRSEAKPAATTRAAESYPSYSSGY
jgi:predicted lipoprotein with Yx(FWY)xxD motif